ncbi:imidazole glycerol phosphate synthase subunit HisH [Proteobacteria bacterium 005FR1]|nr:imidazole glycerol phosphate synthase subunit HisH [Proteobacteria bacterium 005FR1]
MSAKRLAIIDYGMGNLHSVASAINHVAPQVEVDVTADAERIHAADHVIFPGVGAIRDCMAEILRLGVDRKVKEALNEGKPVLGICVGMQALMSFSEENNGVDCLNILPGQVRRFPSKVVDDDGSRLKVPHMGWNQVEQTIDHPLWHGIAQNSHFYFVHSYYVQAEESGQVAGRCHYGVNFSAALQRDNLFAVQFHPEKSHTDGLQLLKNFVAWDGRP